MILSIRRSWVSFRDCPLSVGKVPSSILHATIRLSIASESFKMRPMSSGFPSPNAAVDSFFLSKGRGSMLRIRSVLLPRARGLTATSRLPRRRRPIRAPFGIPRRHCYGRHRNLQYECIFTSKDTWHSTQDKAPGMVSWKQTRVDTRRSMLCISFRCLKCDRMTR